MGKIKDKRKALNDFQAYLDSFSNGKVDRIFIYGRCEKSIKLYRDLRDRLIYVEAFIDNSRNMTYDLIEGKHIFTLDRIGEIKEKVLIILGVENFQPIKEELILKGFSYVISWKDLEGEISRINPIKWISLLDQVGEDNILRDKFRETIFDICKHFN